MKPRKSIISRYSKTTVNTQYYGSIDIANTGETNINITDDKGFVWVPYIPAVSTPIVMDYWIQPTPEEVRAEREKKLERIFK